MKKIVFVMEQLCGGGAERVTAALANEMCNHSEIHLITYRSEMKEYSIDTRVIRHNMGELTGNRINNIRARITFLRNTISAISPDCVLSLAMPQTVILLTIALMGKHIPLVLSERNDPNRFPTSRLARLLRLWAYTACSGVVFQTHDAQNYFPQHIRKKSVVICNPISSNLPSRYEGNREPRIINCCRLHQQKNLDLLIEAFSDIAMEFQDVSLEIWGEGPERERLENKIRETNMDQRIHLPGYSNNIYAEMRKCSMFVSSSDYEGISNSMLEAIALGVPTICTDCPIGGAREMIRDGVNGLLVPTANRAALAAAMRRVLLDQALAERMSQNGYKLRYEISAVTIAEKWLDYIKRIVE